jgi:hypothetical protein
MNLSLQEYEQRMVLPRQRFALSPGLAAILSPAIDPELLELFLAHFCAMGVHMTEPVEGWIRRSGARCEELGLGELGRALKGHANGEAGHELLMIADVKKLTTHWNTHGTLHLDPDALLQRSPSLGTQRYREIHEHTIAGNTPFAQIAIEYEIEMLSLRYGQRLITNCVAQLGGEILGCLSFLTEHVELDVGHTKFISRTLETFLTDHPTCVSALVEAGAAALDAYAQFLSDCLERARRHLGEQHVAEQR